MLVQTNEGKSTKKKTISWNSNGGGSTPQSIPIDCSCLRSQTIPTISLSSLKVAPSRTNCGCQDLVTLLTWFLHSTFSLTTFPLSYSIVSVTSISSPFLFDIIANDDGIPILGLWSLSTKMVGWSSMKGVEEGDHYLYDIHIW